MCTISFVPLTTSCWLSGMSRDERKVRPQAYPPAIYQHPETSAEYLCPIDPEGGGTWIAVNRDGLIMMLMNNYQAVNPELHSSRARSRGLIIPHLIRHSTLDSAMADLEGFRVREYNPFTLFLFSPNEQRTASFAWDGITTHAEYPEIDPCLWISSGFDPEEAYRTRNGEFRRRLDETGHPDAEWMKSLHQSTYPEPGALSIAMHQKEVMTVSASVIEIYPGYCRFYYCNEWPGHNKTWQTWDFALRGN